MAEPALSLDKAAAALGWSRRTLIRALVRHSIPTTRAGRQTRLDASDLERLKAIQVATIAGGTSALKTP